LRLRGSIFLRRVTPITRRRASLHPAGHAHGAARNHLSA
jgi:hypothetical protein